MFPPPAVEVADLTRRFGDLVAVDGVTLTVARATIFGLLGSNGAGKSTLVKMVAGHDIVTAAREVRRRIGYVPQLVSADAMLTGRENLLLSARLYGIARAARAARIDEALAFMELLESADRLVRSYSGGMIRRLEIAQALLHRPEVLFLDEPTVGLDPVARHAVWTRLEDLRARGDTALLITTHDMEEADTLCDDLAILHRGRVHALGTREQLKAALGPDATLEQVFVYQSANRSNPEATTVTSRERGEPRSGSAEARLAAFASQAYAVASAEVRKLARDPTEVISRSVQPHAVAAGLRPGLHAHAGDPDGLAELPGLHGARHPRAERPLHGDLLRHRRDLGARPRHACTSSSSALRTGARSSSARRSRPGCADWFRR